MDKLELLITKLKDILQINRPELDFGIYRVLNSRAEDIENYLNNKLKVKVKELLKSIVDAELKSLENELQEKVTQYSGDGLEPNQVPRVIELQKKIRNVKTKSLEQENIIYSHLLTFFSRYYDQGDFISQRRYKGDTYSIPYSGEEVMLYWANKDQYYTKSGERFSNFSFKTDQGKIVNFHLLTADTAKDNRKDNEKERRFVLIEKHKRVFIDDDGETYEKEFLPIQEDGNELTLNFEYKVFPKGTKQADLVNQAADRILSDSIVKENWEELYTLLPTEQKPKRTLLEKHLTDYTTKNTADYFIHKDLNRFLSSELDFYIKNEVMYLDDIQNIDSFKFIESRLLVIKCLRSIALDIINFLSQLEEFQKQLWLKKKFVVSADYFITLDRVPKTLYPLICVNEKQWKQWRNLGMISNNEEDIDVLNNFPSLMIDTSLFDKKFKEKLLNSIEDLDETVNGTLIHSDNFQALNLLQERYEGRIKCVYIDPPYNTDSTPILYKNGYKHSSWASLMQDRLKLSMQLMRKDGVKAVAIDDSEMVNLSIILKEVAPEYRLSRITVVHNPKGSITKDFNRTHEYALFITREDEKGVIARTLEKNDKPRKMRRWGENSLRTERPLSFYPIYVKDGEITRIGEVPNSEYHPNSKNVLLKSGEIEIWPIDQNGIERRWNFGLDSVSENLSRITVQENEGEFDLFITHELTVPKTVWSGGEFDAGNYGNSLLIDMLGEKRFDFPKSINLVRRCIYLATAEDKDGIVLDFFGGSGTTGQAVISLNREDNGNRKYILVEQGEYFDTVLKTRMQKAVFSAEWEKGKPTAINTGISHCFKVIRLESYEDTLNNLEVKRNSDQENLLRQLDESVKDDYYTNYMFNEESKESLLSVKSFYKPFDFKLKVAVDSAGAYEEKKIDLVESFNYLLGLKVKRINSMLEDGIISIEGTLPSGENTYIIWRDCEKVGYDALNEYCKAYNISPLNPDIDVVYFNGDHNILASLKKVEENGGANHNLIIRQIEPEFLERMFGRRK